MLRVFRGLRGRLLAIMLLALLPATVLLVIYATGQNRISEQRAREDVQRLVEAHSRSVQDLITEARASLVAYSASQAVQRQDWKAAQATAERIKSQQSEYLNIGVVAPDGRLLVSALPTSGTVNVGDRSYFKRAMQYRRFAVGDYQVGRVSGLPSINVALPVLDASGAVRSIVYASLGVEPIRARMAAAPTPSSFREYLVDASGQVIVREPDPVGAASSSLASTPLMAAMQSNSRGIVTSRGADGATLEYAYMPVFREPGGGLYLAIGFSPSELFAPEAGIFAMTLGGFGLVALAALTASWIAGTRWVYRPTRKLREVATQIGRGRLSARADLRSGTDEFADLGLQFDSMAETIERRVELSQALAEVNRLAHSTLEFDEVMQRIISVTCDAVGAETAALVMREQGQWCTKYSYHFPQEITGAVLTDEQAPHAAMALKSGHPVAIDDAYEDPRINNEVMRGYGIRSVLTMPLIVQDEVIGVVFMNHHTRPVTFDRAQVDFAESVAATVALALHNARLYQAEHRIAEALQQSLLALPVTLPHLRFAHVYRSAAEAARVGGDFYDLFQIEGDLIGVTIGDVSGKGLDAAVLTSIVKNTVRAQAMDADKTPAQVMAVANKVLFRESEPEMFATVFFGVLDTATGRLVYCNAGHPTVALGRPGTPMTALRSNSTLVGAFPDVAFVDSVATMGRDDLLFLYTDGLTEARGGDGMFGTERVFSLLEELESSDPWIAAARAVQAAGDFAGGHLSDDLAILAVELTDR